MSRINQRRSNLKLNFRVKRDDEAKGFLFNRATGSPLIGKCSKKSEVRCQNDAMFKSTAIITNYLLLLTIANIKCDNQQPNKDDALRSRNFIFSQAAQTTTTQPATIGQEQPDFSEPIGNQTVALGRDAQLSCKIENLGNFRTAWLRVEDKGILTIHNNIITRNYRFGLISNDNGKNFILTIKQVQASDKGGYMCQINSNPMKYAIGYLDVLMPPVFEDSPTASSSSGGRNDENNLNGEPATTINPSQVPNSLISAREGTNVTLTCKANGHPQPVITWRREDNGPILINNSNNQLEEFQKLEGSSVHLGQVSKMSSGAYLCIASNGVQPSISRRLVLDVQFSPIIMLPQKEIGAYVNQDRIKLTCIIESNPVSSYYWVKVPNSSSNRAAIVSNSNGDSIVDSLNLNDEDDLTLLEHERITNSDKYEIVVNKNDAVANSSEKRELLLIIRSLNKHDFGSYKCLAKNSLGLQSNTIQLYQLTPSSFSLNNMFRGSPIEAEGNQDKQQHQQNDQQPDEEAENSGSGVRKQSGQARTYTRSSWFQRPFIGRGESLTPSKAILDSQSSSPASSASAPSANLLFQLFLLSACIPVALLAQIVNLLYKN